MAAITQTVSINPEQKAFLEEHSISPSQIFQQKVNELMEMSHISGAQLKELERKLEAWRKIAEKARTFITNKGLLDEWLGEQGA